MYVFVRMEGFVGVLCDCVVFVVVEFDGDF